MPSHHAIPSRFQFLRTAPTRIRSILANLHARWLWQPDKWERLTTVAGLTGDAATVADVGGRGHELHGLLAGTNVISVNIEEPCDVLVPPGPLPFEDDAFDAVTSTDVLEHVPAADREAHISELLRVARQRVVICFPCGSETKDASEQRLGQTLEQAYGIRFDFLDEHLRFGLPRVDDVLAAVNAAAPRATPKVEYQDGVMEAEQLLLDAVRAVKGHRPTALFRSTRSWLVRRRTSLSTRQSEDNNRAYVVIELATTVPQ